MKIYQLHKILYLLFSHKVIIKLNKVIFEKKLSKIIKINNTEKRLNKIKEASTFAVNNMCGYLSSALIEQELLKIAQSITINISSDYEKNSYLHVLTHSYNTGGHTRVVERWINNSPNYQKHSVVIVNQNPDVNTSYTLEEKAKLKNGNLFQLKIEKDYIQKAIELRSLSCNYQCIILHTHMDDIVPLLAFGTKEFQRPVIIFNHADHLFWLGVSIADLVVNFRSSAQRLNTQIRQITKNYVLPLSLNAEYYPDLDNIEKTKSDLGLETGSKIILTMASPYKYSSFDDYNFLKHAREILKKIPNSYLIAIGPSIKNREWLKAFLSSERRILPLGLINHAELPKYLKIADLYLDSFPFSSATSLLDVVKYNVPALVLKTPINDIDSYYETGVYCNSPSELIERSIKILMDLNSKKNNLPIQKYFLDNHCEESYLNKLSKLYEIIPKSHEINIYADRKDRKISDHEIFVCKMKKANFKKSFLRKIRDKIYYCFLSTFHEGIEINSFIEFNKRVKN